MGDDKKIKGSKIPWTRVRPVLRYRDPKLPTPWCPEEHKDLILQSLPSPIKEIMEARGYDIWEARAFIEGPNIPNYFRHLILYNDSFVIGLETAKDVIEDSIKRNDTIVVYGDYDVDGLSASALMTTTLRKLGANVRPYIPSRYVDGYGLYPAILHYFARAGVNLIVTVDCGIRSLDEVNLAHELGMKIIITDHHELPPIIPMADAVVCPRIGRSKHCHDLAGVGVAYALAQHLDPTIDHTWAEQLVALGTVADLAPLKGLNRYLVQRGLKGMRNNPILAVQVLAESARVNLEKLTARDIAFMLGPRLNAAGRMDAAWNAYHVLSNTDPDSAKGYARALEKANRERQRLTKEATVQAENLLADQANDRVLLTFCETFSHGLVGLIAGTLCRQTGRPTIIGTLDEEGMIRASARSPDSFHITNALADCAEADPDMLVSFGGHAKAAGLTVPLDKVNQLHEMLNDYAKEIYPDELPVPEIWIDAHVRLQDISMDLLVMLDWLEPFGSDNPEPVLIARGVTVDSMFPVGKTKDHVRFSLRHTNHVVGAIAFNRGYWMKTFKPGDTVDVVFTPQYNAYDDDIQMVIEDMEPNMDGKWTADNS